MTTTTTAPPSGLVGVGCVVVSVSDYDRSVAFYSDVLGFEKTADLPFAGTERWIEMSPPSGVPIAFGRPPSGQVGLPTGIVLQTADLAATHAHLLAAEVDADPPMPPMEGAPPLFFFRDPDGNTLIVVEDAQPPAATS